MAESRTVKALVERRNSSDVVQWIREAKLINSIVRLEGARTVNTMDCDLAFTDVQEQDHIKYIQDIVDVAYLTSIYNFQANDRDEGGFDLDGDNTHTEYVDPNETKDTIANTQRFKSQYGIIFNGTGDAGFDKIIVGDDTRHNFTKQFDLYCWVRHHNTSGSDDDINIFYSKIDRANADSDSGIEIGSKKILGAWSIYVRIRQAGSETEIIGDSSDVPTSGRPRLLHVWRDENDDIFVRIDQRNDSTPAQGTNISGTLSTTQPIWIGAGRNTSNAVVNRWRGAGWQLRMYNGIYLKDEEVHLLHEQAPTPTTMKFLGRIWKVDDKTSFKACKAKSLGKLLLQTIFNATLLNTTHTDELANRTDDNPVFDSGQENHDILQSMITRADGDYVYYVNPSSGQTITGEYVGEGSFDTNAELLLAQSQDTFQTLARKIFIVENDDGVGTDIVFTNGGVKGERITLDGKDDTNTVNDLEIIGRARPLHDTTSYGVVDASGGDTTETTTHPPLNLRVVEHTGSYLGTGIVLNEGASGDYIVNYDISTITFINGYTSGGDNVTAEYDFDFASSSDGDSLFIRSEDTGSITENGRYSKRLMITQFTEKSNDLTRVASRILTRQKNIIQRVTVFVPILYNAIRENYEVEINNATKGITAEDKVIRQIIYRYPEATTEVICGEIQFDQLEWQKFERNSMSSTVANMNKNKAEV